MPEVRVQAIFTLAPNAGTNKAVNTFHFTTADLSFDLAAQSCLNAVEQFYTTPPPGLAASLGARMAATIDRPFELRAYDMTIAPPRVPVIRASNLPAAIAGGIHIPADVAACLSYTAAPPVNGRNRGRIYIPGVGDDWVVQNASNTQPVVLRNDAASPVDVLLRAAKQLRDFAGVEWVVRSNRPVGTHTNYPIVAGYVDAELDTQRRRGIQRGSARFPVPA